MCTMTEKSNFTSLVRENKTLVIIITVGLFLVELQIFAVAAVKSGRKSWLQVFDQRGTVIYETDGTRLSDFNKYYFEKTFGPLENYDVKLVTREISFPFRAWFVAAVGVPIGAVLLFGFVFRAYMSLVNGEKATPSPNPTADGAETRLEQILDRVGRLNIFAMGFLAFIIVIAYWVLPNAVAHLGKAGFEALIRYKWVFLAVAAVLLAVVLWIIYLRYLLAKKTIESQAEVDKYRLQLEYQPDRPPEQIEYLENAAADASTVAGGGVPASGAADRES